MSVKARCLNYTGCLLAYRGEIIELPNHAPLVCPECGKTVSAVQNKGGGVGKVLALLVGLAVIGAVLYFLVPKLGNYVSRKPAATEEPTGAPPPAAPPAPGTGADPAPGTASPTPVAPITTPSPPVSPAKIDMSLNKLENQKVRDEVLKRIDAIPKLTKVQKDKLYNSVLRAKSMGLIVTIPFGSGVTRLPANEIPALKAELEKPAIRAVRDEPTYVFVVLGYADPKGDEAKNLQISQTRADSVLEAMRDKCGITNVMHAVAMGGSKLMDETNLEKNRVVEVWAVLP